MNEAVRRLGTVRLTEPTVEEITLKLCPEEFTILYNLAHHYMGGKSQIREDLYKGMKELANLAGIQTTERKHIENDKGLGPYLDVKKLGF